METVSEDGTRTIRIVSTYSPAQKRATQKYRHTNKEKVNLQRKVYYQMRKDKDPDFLLYKRQKAKEYYLRKKEYKKSIKEELNEPLTEVIEEVKPVKVKKERKKREPKIEPFIEKNNHADEAEKEKESKRKPKTAKESRKIIMDLLDGRLGELEKKPVIEEIIEEFKQTEPEPIEPEPIVEEVKIEKIKKVKKSKKSKDALDETVLTIEIDKKIGKKRL
jgi:hypothetical protein